MRPTRSAPPTPCSSAGSSSPWSSRARRGSSPPPATSASRWPPFPVDRRQRPRGGGRLRGSARARAARRAGTCAAPRVRERRGRHRRLAPRVLHGDADDVRDRGRPRRPGGRVVSPSRHVSRADLSTRPRRRAAPHRRGVGTRAPAAPCSVTTAASSSSRPTTRPAVPSACATTRWRWRAVPTCSTASRPPLSRPGVDGVLGTADVLDDLLLMGALEGKVVIGSMNRGGLQGATFELDDRFTGLHRRRDRRPRPRRRQDADPDRPRRPRHGRDPRGERAGRHRPRRTRADGDGRAVPGRSSRTAGSATCSTPTRRSASIHVAVRARRLERPHLAQAARRRRPPPRHGRHDAARPCCSAVTPRATRTTPTPRGAGRSRCPRSAGLVVGRALLYPPDGDVAAAVDIAADLVHGADR